MPTWLYFSAVSITVVLLAVLIGYWGAWKWWIKKLRDKSSERGRTNEALNAQLAKMNADCNQHAALVAVMLEQRGQREAQVQKERAELEAQIESERTQLEALNKRERAKLEAEVNDARIKLAARQPTTLSEDMVRRSVVVVDGDPESGATFVTRIVSPETSISDLDGNERTHERRVSAEVPLCFERSANGKVTLHTLQFVEFVADGEVQSLNAIEAAGGIASHKVIALWAVDMSRPEQSRARRSATLLKQIYGSELAKKTLHGIFVWFDRLEALEALDPAVRNKMIHAEGVHIKNALKAARLDYKVDFFYGSALDDQGLFTAWGRIQQLLDVATNRPRRPNRNANGHGVGSIPASGNGMTGR